MSEPDPGLKSKERNDGSSEPSPEDGGRSASQRLEREQAKARDNLLVEQTLKGDRAAFQQLFEIYRFKVQSIAYEVLKSKEDAEDVVQEAFVKAYLALPSYRKQAAFYTWLFRIVYNMAIDYKRRIVRKGGDPLELKEEILNSTEVSTSYGANGSLRENPHERLERRQELSRVQRALNRISEEHRTVILLREVDGLSYDEIASVVGVSKGTVMSRLHYARRALTASLKDDGS